MNSFIKVILLVLLAAVITALTGAHSTDRGVDGKEFKARATLKDIVIGLRNYHVEYGRWPVSNNDEVKIPCAGALLQNLLGDNVGGLNVRNVAYIEPPMATKGAGGLTGVAGNYQLTDPWGHPYVLLLDANGDGKIDNPDRKNTEPSISGGAPAQIVAEFVVFSLGPDGIGGTKDDVVLWR